AAVPGHAGARLGRPARRADRPPRPDCSRARPTRAPRTPRTSWLITDSPPPSRPPEWPRWRRRLGLAAASWSIAVWQMHGMDMGVTTRPGSFASFAAGWGVGGAGMMAAGAGP